MKEGRPRPNSHWPHVTAVLIVLPVLYIASFGPLAWAYDRGMLPIEMDGVIDGYAVPLKWAPQWFGDLVEAYITLWR